MNKRMEIIIGMARKLNEESQLSEDQNLVAYANEGNKRSHRADY